MNLKEEYNIDFILSLANNFLKADSTFNSKLFVKKAKHINWEEKELKERMRATTFLIHESLPCSYSKQLELLLEVAPNYSGLQGLIFPDFVQVYGIDHFNSSLNALEEFTKYSTAEFAVRPFIEKYPNEMINQMLIWSKNKNEHVRRLSSEGIRPKLPWAKPLKFLIEDPLPIFPILENLKNDSSEYVRKSVANNLNDISKSHPNIVIDITNKWKGKSVDTNRMIKHGLRTLLKKGDLRALSIFKFDEPENVNVVDLEVTKPQLKIGDDFSFSFKIINESNIDKKIRIEYKIGYVKANNSISKKVFQLSELILKSNQAKNFKRKHSFKDLTTRKHYPGKHQLIIVVNGVEKQAINFVLKQN